MCKNIDDVVAHIMTARNLQADQVDVKLGIDSGQAFLKLTCSVSTRPEYKEASDRKRLRFSDGYESSKLFLDTSVKKNIYPWDNTYNS